MTPDLALQAACEDYTAAHHAHQAATAKAKAASARYSIERTRDAREAMVDAWRVCDKAMRAMFDARDRLCQAAVDSGQTSLFDEVALSNKGEP